MTQSVCFTGKAGGIFAAWRDLTIQGDGVEFVPMNVSHSGEEWKVEVPGLAGRRDDQDGFRGYDAQGRAASGGTMAQPTLTGG